MVDPRVASNPKCGVRVISNHIRLSVFGYKITIFTLCYLFKGFIRINFLSKILVLLIAFSVSSNFHVMLWYNHFSECFFMVVLIISEIREWKNWLCEFFSKLN